MKILLHPMVILLEVMMLLVLAFIMARSPDIKIIPPNKYLSDMLIVSSHKGQLLSYFNKNENSWADISTYVGDTKFIIPGGICKNDFCKSIPSPLKGEKYIFYTGEIEREISSLVTDSCLTFPEQCTQVRYYIKENGSVDKSRLCKEHPNFKRILKEESCHSLKNDTILDNMRGI